MCAMDRSSDESLSQSLRDTLFHIKSLYRSSPVSVCVRNSERIFLYTNLPFEQLYGHLITKKSSDKENFETTGIEIFLSTLEMECCSLGNGGVLNRSFSNKSTKFNVYMECRVIDSGEMIIIWMMSFFVLRPIIDFKAADGSSKFNDKFRFIISSITDKNLIALSFYMVGFDISETSHILNVEKKALESRTERAKKKIKLFYPSFLSFKIDCFQNDSIYFFLRLVLEILSVKNL